MMIVMLFSYQQKALEAAMNDINSSFGKGSVTRLGSAGGALVYVAFVPVIQSYRSRYDLFQLFNHIEVDTTRYFTEA